MSRDDVPEPWRAFLADLDALISADPRFGAEPILLHCTGGFVFTILYGLERATNDIDIIEVVPSALMQLILQLAGKGTALAEEHKVYIDPGARVADLPCDYQERLIEMYPGAFKRLRLFAPDPYDLALSKLERNADRDIEDVKLLATRAGLDPETLRHRYHLELQPYLVGPVAKHDLTLTLWIDILKELGQRRS